MGVECDLCLKTYSSLRNLRRHKQNIHNTQPKVQPFACSDCDFQNTSLVTMKQHFLQKHGHIIVNHSLYCNIVYGEATKYSYHLEHDHGLPTIFTPRENDNIERMTGYQQVEKAFWGSLETYQLKRRITSIDLFELLCKEKNQIQNLIREKCRNGPKKFQLTTELKLVKPKVDDDSQETITIYTNTKLQPVYFYGITDNDYYQLIEQLTSALFTFASQGSGWILSEIKNLFVKFTSYSPIRGSSYIALPNKLQGCRSLLNIRNIEDENCFIYCYTAAYHLHTDIPLVETSSWRCKTNPGTYNPTYNPLAKKHAGNFRMPMPFHELERFEKLNKVQVNVFILEKKDLLPLRVSKFPSDFIMDLLLLSEGGSHHYVLITDLKHFVNFLKNKQSRSRDEICRNCFHICSSTGSFEIHKLNCYENEAAAIILPDEHKNIHQFKNTRAVWFVPLVIYLDTEALLVPLSTCAPSPSISSQVKLEKHVPCGYAFVIVEHGNDKVLSYRIMRGPDCLDDLIKELEKLATDIYHRKQSHRIYKGKPSTHKDTVNDCWICKKPFTNDEQKVLDHCHYSGTFLGWAHSECNLQRKSINFTPVIAHNMAGYDIHHICSAINNCNPKNKFSVIPTTDEKYISFTFSVWVNSYTDKNGMTKNVYEDMRFLDSFKFMPQSLDKLAGFLPQDKFIYLESQFNTYKTPSQIDLLKRKGVYPYSYMDSFDKFAEEKLPPKEFWKNTLAGGEVTISDQDLQHASLVYQDFDCKTLGHYHDLYLHTDVLILASVFEEFRKVCYATYGLDCAHFYTASNLSGEAFLKVCNADIELLTNREHLEVAENLIRGGISSVFAKRKFEANNKYLPTYNSSQKQTFGLFIDANNLYGGIMEKFPLPLKNFVLKREGEVDLQEILNTPNDSPVGYVLEVDLHYPDHLHDLHTDFPLAPTKETINFFWLGEYQTRLLEMSGTKTFSTKNKKLIQTLYDKTNYTIHCMTLKLYCELGLQVTKVHRVLQFEQSKWLQPYIQLNTMKRKASTNKFEENFFKLMSNSAFGKTMESKRKRLSIEIVRTQDELQKQTSKMWMKTFKIFNNQLAAITFAQRKIYWDKPTIVGATILDLSKRHMYWFHYMYMKPNFRTLVLYSDTDSLIYEIESEDIYADLKENEQVHPEFDFSNYKEDNQLYSKHQKLETLKFKDEVGGKIIHSIVALKSKLYSIAMGDQQKISAKGTTKHAQKNLQHSVFYRILEKETLLRTLNYTINSERHNLFTLQTTKISLSCFDDKRYIMPNGVDTLPFGHYSLRDDVIFREIGADCDWGDEEEDFIQSPIQSNSNQPALFSPPDPGLNQDAIEESELPDVIDLTVV